MERMPKRLYRERASQGISEKVSHLRTLRESPTNRWELSDSEREHILTIEHELGVALEKLFVIPSNTASFSLPALELPEGRTLFNTLLGQDILTTSMDRTEVRAVVYAVTEKLRTLPQNAIGECCGALEKLQETALANELTLSDTGDLQIPETPTSFEEEVTILLNAADNEKKVQGLRSLKATVVSKRQTLADAPIPDDARAAYLGMYDLYQARINELLAESAALVSYISKKQNDCGTSALTPEEQTLLELFPAGHSTELRLARYDKFQTGTDNTKYPPEGYHVQIGDTLRLLADAQEERYIEELPTWSTRLEAAGLSREKLETNNLEASKMQAFAEQTLAHYNLLSTEPADSYLPERHGAATDGKWQAIIHKSYNSMSVERSQRVVLLPENPDNIVHFLATGLAHEIEGHVLQAHNLSKLPLQLCQKVGAARSEIFAEAGAIANEDFVSNAAFAKQKLTHPHYIRAMITKLEGGTYMDCIKSFYESAKKLTDLEHAEGFLDTASYQKALKRNRALAINRTKRLFRGGADKTTSYTHLAQSKASVYLEQNELAAALKAEDMNDLLYLTGVNIEMLTFMLKANLIKFEDIQKPDFFALDIWKNIKSHYER